MSERTEHKGSESKKLIIAVAGLRKVVEGLVISLGETQKDLADHKEKIRNLETMVWLLTSNNKFLAEKLERIEGGNFVNSYDRMQQMPPFANQPYFHPQSPYTFSQAPSPSNQLPHPLSHISKQEFHQEEQKQQKNQQHEDYFQQSQIECQISPEAKAESKEKAKPDAQGKMRENKQLVQRTQGKLKISYYEDEEGKAHDLKAEVEGYGWTKLLQPVCIEGLSLSECFEVQQNIGVQIANEDWQQCKQHYYICNFNDYTSKNQEEKLEVDVEIQEFVTDANLRILKFDKDSGDIQLLSE